MPGAQNSPRTDEDPVGPRQGVAGGPVGYKQGMRTGAPEKNRHKATQGTGGPEAQGKDPRGRRGGDGSDPFKEHKTVPGWMRIQPAGADGIRDGKPGAGAGPETGWGERKRGVAKRS